MESRNSVDHTTMREMNLSLILNTLRLRAPLSRAGVALETGLNKASVSSMVRELIDKNLIREIGINPAMAEIGRPGINLQLNPEAGYIISAEIGVDFISVIATNFGFEVVARRYESTEELHSQREIFDCLLAYLRDIKGQLIQQRRSLLAVAVSVPGLVDMQTGTLLLAPNLEWADVPLRALLLTEFDVPIFIANEANMAALGESYYGMGQHSRLLLYVSSGVGLGGGIVVDGQLLTGISGLAGEFGHMTVNPDGIKCKCGNIGCWETTATQSALFRRIKEATAAGRKSMLLDSTSGSLDRLTVPLVAYAAQQGDVVACEALTETARWIGIGIASLMNTLNPEHVVFGGKLSLAHEFMMPIIQAEIECRAFSWIREKTTFAIAMHVDDASVMGGVAMVHRGILKKPLSWQVQPEF